MSESDSRKDDTFVARSRNMSSEDVPSLGGVEEDVSSPSFLRRWTVSSSVSFSLGGDCCSSVDAWSPLLESFFVDRNRNCS